MSESPQSPDISLVLINKCYYNNYMQIECDEQKRVLTFNARGLDFRDATIIFAGEHYTLQDLRKAYSEPRFLTVGWLNQQMILVVWTPRNHKRRIISMRKCNERERKIYEKTIHP